MHEGKSIRTVIRYDFPQVLPRPVQAGFLILSPGAARGINREIMTDGTH